MVNSNRIFLIHLYKYAINYKKLLVFIIFLVVIIAGSITFKIFNPFGWQWMQDLKKCDISECPEIECPEIEFGVDIINKANCGILCEIVKQNYESIEEDKMDNVKFAKIVIDNSASAFPTLLTLSVYFYDCDRMSIADHSDTFQKNETIIKDNTIKFISYFNGSLSNIMNYNTTITQKW